MMPIAPPSLIDPNLSPAPSLELNGSAGECAGDSLFVTVFDAPKPQHDLLAHY